MLKQYRFLGQVCLVVLMLSQPVWGQTVQTDLPLSYTLRYGGIKEKPWHYNLKVENVVQFDVPEEGMVVTRRTILTNDYTLTFVSQDENKNLQMDVMVNEIKNNVFHTVFRYGRVLNTGSINDFSKVNGKMFRMVTTELGEELEYRGNDELKGVVRTQDGRVFYIEMENLFQNVLFDYPEKAKSVGDTWQVENTNKTMEPEGAENTVTTKSIFRLEGIEKIGDRDCLKINVDAEGNTSGFQTKTKSNPSNYQTHTGTFVSSGTVYVDPKEGVVVKTSHIITTRGNMDVRLPIAGNYNEPFTSTRTVSLTLQQ